MSDNAKHIEPQEVTEDWDIYFWLIRYSKESHPYILGTYDSKEQAMESRPSGSYHSIKLMTFKVKNT